MPEVLLLSFSSTYRKLNLIKSSLFSRILAGSSLPLLGEDDRKEFYLHSLSAIYEVFMAEQIGCKVTHLRNIGVSHGNPYEGRRCRITKEPILRKRRFKPAYAVIILLANLYQKQTQSQQSTSKQQFWVFIR